MAKQRMNLYFLSRQQHVPSPPIQKDRREPTEEWKTSYLKQFTCKQAEPVFPVKKPDHTVILSDPAVSESKEKSAWELVNNVILPVPNLDDDGDKSAWKIVNNVIMPDPIRRESDGKSPWRIVNNVILPDPPESKVKRQGVKKIKYRPPLRTKHH